MSDEAADAVEKVWREWWRDIVAPDGKLDLEQIKRELYDYHMVLNEVAIVYDTLTSGRISKPNTRAAAVIAAAEEVFEDMHEWEREATE